MSFSSRIYSITCLSFLVSPPTTPAVCLFVYIHLNILFIFIELFYLLLLSLSLLLIQASYIILKLNSLYLYYSTSTSTINISICCYTKVVYKEEEISLYFIFLLLRLTDYNNTGFMYEHVFYFEYKKYQELVDKKNMQFLKRKDRFLLLRYIELVQ